jgi:hypothetical protein
MWLKPFVDFAPRMRVMRYASERRLQTPNIAAHYKTELRILLQVKFYVLADLYLIFFSALNALMLRLP